MANTSWSWPNMFDVARNKVGLYSDNAAVISRVKLLMLTEPTEMFMSPNFGVGLKRYLFTYNNDNTIAMIRDKLVEQLRLWEPEVIPERTTVTRGLEYSGKSNEIASASAMTHLELTVRLVTLSGADLKVTITESDIKSN